MTWTLTLPYAAPPLLANKTNRGTSRGARMGHAKKAQQIKGDVTALAKAARIPAQGAIHVRLHYRPKDRRRRDPDGLAPTFKHCLDGLVAAGVVPDDTQQYIDWSRPLIHEPADDRTPALWLVITPMVAS